MNKLQQALQSKYPTTAKKIISMYYDANGVELSFTSVDKPSLAKMVEQMRTTLALSSVKTYAAQLKSVLNLYSEELTMPKGWEKVLSVRNDISEQVYLTDAELQRVIEYTPDTLTEAIVQQQFILSALVGARHGDIISLTEANIHGQYLCYVSQKTHIKAQVPLCDTVRRILSGQFKHNLAIVNEEKAYTDAVSDMTYNATLRRICMLCDIDEPITLYKRGAFQTRPKYEFVSSHTGRRTCATLLYLHKCDVYTISRILAHNSVEMTSRRYILAPIRELERETEQFFKNY